MSPVCQSCGSEGNRWIPGYPELDVHRCEECLSLTYRKTEGLDLSAIYSEEYFQGGEYEDYAGHRAVHERNFARRWAMLQPYLPRPLRIFEVGCAYGFFLDFARRKGAESVFGIDISREAVDFARSQFGPFFEVASRGSRPPFPFNCLVAWDVWEHLEDPFDWFGELVGDLQPGGIVGLTTVDSGAAVARWRGRRWRQLHPPTHIHYPTRQGLARGLARLGLRVLRQRYLGYYRALESYLRPLRLEGLVRPFPRLRTLPVPLDLRDIQIVIAQKVSAPPSPSLSSAP
jgi:SAM-dependent methyltransferase